MALTACRLFRPKKSVDLADIVAGAHQQRLQFLDLFEGQRRRRVAAMQRRCAGDAGRQIRGGGGIDQRVVPLQIDLKVRIDQKCRPEPPHRQQQRCRQTVVGQRPAVGERDAPGRPFGSRQLDVEVGLVPRQLCRHVHLGHPWLAALPAEPDQIVGSGAEHVGHVVNEIALAVAVIVDGVFVVFGRHHLRLAEFAGPGADAFRRA